jgi:hypothetical protein
MAGGSGRKLREAAVAESVSPARQGARQISVGDIVRDVIADAAPAELPVVDGLRQLDPDTARKRLRRRRQSRDPVGFGLDVVVPLMTPVAWIAIDELVRRIVDDASGSLAGRTGKALRAVGRRVTHRSQAEVTATATVSPLSPAQLEEVRRRVLELAPKYYLASMDAEALADRVVARLVLASADPGAISKLPAGTKRDPAQ